VTCLYTIHLPPPLDEGNRATYYHLPWHLLSCEISATADQNVQRETGVQFGCHVVYNRYKHSGTLLLIARIVAVSGHERTFICIGPESRLPSPSSSRRRLLSLCPLPALFPWGALSGAADAYGPSLATSPPFVCFRPAPASTSAAGIPGISPSPCVIYAVYMGIRVLISVIVSLGMRRAAGRFYMANGR